MSEGYHVTSDVTTESDKTGVMENVTQELRTIRLDKGLSLRALGEVMSTSQTTIFDLESGKRTPNIVQLDEWARALGVRVRILVERPEDDDKAARLDPNGLVERLVELLPRLSASQYEALSTILDSMGQGNVNRRR